MTDNKKRLVLLDGYSLMFRAYYATAYRGNLMQTSTGIYTNAIYGFYAMTNKLLTSEEYTFVALDAGSQTFRHQEFPEYKGTRKPVDQELISQIPLVKRYLDILNIRRFETLDYEADDLLASVATKFYDDFDEIVIVSGDRDLLQLVNDKVKVLLPLRGTSEFDEYNIDNFYEKMSIYPNQVTDYKGMVGDTSDNLPGIKGIGDKTAVKLLNEYQTLENILENLDNLKGKVKENFEEYKEIGLKCKYLATLKRDVKIVYSKEDLRLEKYDVDDLTNFLKELEFNSFLRELNKKTFIQEDINYTIISDVNADLTSILNSEGFMNMEIFGKTYYVGEFLGISYVSDKCKIFLTKEVVVNNKSVRAYLEGNEKKNVFDLKAFLLVLNRYGISLNNVVFDLMIAAYIINPNFGASDFKQVISNFEDNSIAYYETIYGANTKAKIPMVDVYAKYSVEKSLALKLVKKKVLSQIIELDIEELYNMEMALAAVLSKIEENGLLVDVDRLNTIGIDLNNRIKVIEKEIIEIAGVEFNINSPKQLGEVLFEKLNLPHGKKNKTGYSTNVDVLEKLAPDFLIARKVLEYRGLNKLITTYVNGIKDLVDDEGYIHPLYKQTETQTGRLASIEPNIQNMPIRTEEGQVIREIFTSRFKNGKILAADYSQIELRVLAHMSGDKEMIDAFNHSVDFHSLTASRLYEVEIENVSKDMRRMAKAINFGIIYGMSAWGLSETINVSPLEANIYINKYFDTFKESKKFLDSLIEGAKKDGFTKTILNRRRYIPEAMSSNANLRAFGERTAMNAPIQGSAADIIKIAMVNLDKRMKQENIKSLMIAQVHDELVFDCVLEELDLVEKIVREEMEKAYSLKVKLVVGTASGTSWSEAK
ncbi:MAG: DNA polymerase I [Bacilli bacterium]|nr:DNA polymerase I [Bacilli bacterium]